ncbi:Pom152 protein [Maudiozyma humilis]|uniref:Pom152 protein n=1 Tax=Maudiozyma humilis TaxID=51915 RepID=A0AAV5RTF8_MAUHU|nr:Pom152 protein [Kazachstania humilis]
MSYRANAFSDTPRGNHWMGSTPKARTSAYNRTPMETEIRRHSNEDAKNINVKSEYKSNEKNGPVAVDITNHQARYNNMHSESQPLLSTEVLDASKQRTLALTVFLIIQAYKIYDALLLNSELPVSGLSISNYRFNFVTKYFAVDSLFLYLLPLLKVPRLTFKKYVTYIQMILMGAVTLFLSMDHDWLFLFAVISRVRQLYFQNDVTVGGASVNRHQKVIDYSSHFKGSLTIKILPENTAMFNPLHESYCLPLDTNLISATADRNAINNVNIPVRINSTDEIKFIQLEFRDLYTNEIELKNLTTKDFENISDLTTLLKKDRSLSLSDIPEAGNNQKEDEHSSMRYINIPIKEIGFYQIRKIVDTKNLNLKVYQSHVIVPHCPTASLVASGSSKRCLGDLDEITMELQGVPPLKLSYSKTIDEKEYSYMDTNLQPEFFKSPLTQSNLQNAKMVFSVNNLDDLTWARSHPVTIRLNSSTVFDGHYKYKIDKLVDSLGNVMDFSVISDSLKERYGLQNEFDVFNSPRASLDETFNADSPTKRDIVVKFENQKNWNKDIPLTVHMSFIDSNVTDISHENIENFTIQSTELTKVFHAERPGRYVLQSVSSNYCSGIIIGKSSVSISKPIPPHLAVSSTPIMDQCLGQVGLDFDLTFTGIPPFHYSVKIFKLEGDRRKLFETKRLTSKGSRNHFSYTPTTEGSYEISFDHISNDLYRDPIVLKPTDEYTFKTSMRVKPSANIALRNYRGSLNLCLNQAADIPIDFGGEPPFQFTYDILETTSNNKVSQTVEDIPSRHYQLATRNFDIGGDYILTLVSVKDASGCVVSLSEPDVRIVVRRDVPSASFNGPTRGEASDILIKDSGVAEIPLKLSGEGPFTVKYEHVDLNGRLVGTYENRFESSYKANLRVNKEGFYKLVEMRDASCKGEIIDPERQFTVSYLTKPTFIVQNKFSKLTKLTDSVFVNTAVCQDMGETIDLVLTGSPPFIVNYDLVTPRGEVHSESMQVTTRHASLRIPNNEAGEYVVTIKSIYDSNYEENESKSIATINNDADEKVIRQTVYPLPYVEFTEEDKTFRTCFANIDQKSLLDPIKLTELSGDGPFTIVFSIYHESTSRTEELIIENISAASFPYEKLYENLNLGNHIISIVRITDQNGCTNDLRNIQNSQIAKFMRGSIDRFTADGDDINGNSISISITDVPKIHLLDPNVEYCVGDYVAYQLNGIAPFTIQYTFNDLVLKSQEHTSQFVRLASEPGLITIDAIEDSTSQCLVNFTKPGMRQEFDKLSLNVHPIPSVTVSQGNYIIEDIHEGDQAEVIFSFEGTPPFTLTYVRTEDTDVDSDGFALRRPQVVETHKVTDIYAYQYRVVTSLQGTYEAIEISDAYCFAKNDAFFNV